MNILTATADGSNTLYNETIGEHYHSAHGALQESKHVFLNAGLIDFIAASGKKEIDILEVGFGTGLNFLMSFDYCEKQQIALHYTGIEAFPLEKTTIGESGYNQYVAAKNWQRFVDGYDSALIQTEQLSSLCELTIANTKLSEFQSYKLFDVVYFDAFSVRHQPEMWTDEIIAHTCSFLKKDGFFVTYAITGNLKRALKARGFEIQKLPGAPGKREMLRARKL